VIRIADPQLQLGADDTGENTPILSIVHNKDRAFRVWKRPSWLPVTVIGVLVAGEV
jgi:hypothetical protein